MALREMAWGGSPAMSSPLKTIRPLVGRRTPVKQLKKVDLPAPLGADDPADLAAGHGNVTLLTAARPPNRTVRASVSRIGADDVVSVATRAANQEDGGPRNGPPLPQRSGARETRGAPLNELARRRDERLLLGNRLQELVLVVLDREDELAQERLMIFLPDRLVALREVVAFLTSMPSRASIRFIVSSRPRNFDFCMPSFRKFIASKFDCT